MEMKLVAICMLWWSPVLLALAGSTVALPQSTVQTTDLEEYAPIIATTAASIVAAYDQIGDSGPGIEIGSIDGIGIGIAGISDSLEFSAIPEEPSVSVTPCNVNDPNRNECIKGLFQQLVPNLKDGLPEYNMGSIDPYFYKRGIFRYANDGVQGGLLIKNMYINGISTLRVNNILTNFTGNDFVVKVNVEIPKLKAGGQFKADVKFGGLRLVPKGPFNITIDNVRATILTDGSFDTSEFGQRLRLHRLNANVAIGNAHIVANGIFSDRNLNTMMLNLVNENLPEITRVGIPATREQWAPILVAHINDFFANVPIDKFLVQ